MTLNLTNHKEKLLPNGKKHTHKPHLVEQFDKANRFEPRFDKFFSAVGHSFTQSFDVIRQSYWLEYNLITHFDCAVYDTIYFFCRKNIPFSLSVLATRMKCSKETLRESLDNLENAELLEIIKVNDNHGQYNCYLLKSPLFTRESIEINTQQKPDSNDNKAVRATRQKFFDKELPLPTEFLNDHLDRLRYQIERNNVKRIRLFMRKASKTGKLRSFTRELFRQKADRKFMWKEISHTLGNLAVEFESFIFSITKRVAIIPKRGGEFSKALKSFINDFCTKHSINYTAWMKDKAEKLIEFFCIRLKISPAKAEENFYQNGSESVGENNSEVVENEEFADIDYTQITAETRQRVKQIVANGRNWTKTIQEIVQKFRNLPLPSGIVEQIVTEFVPAQYRDKIIVELRT